MKFFYVEMIPYLNPLFSCCKSGPDLKISSKVDYYFIFECSRAMGILRCEIMASVHQNWRFEFVIQNWRLWKSGGGLHLSRFAMYPIDKEYTSY